MKVGEMVDMEANGGMLRRRSSIIPPPRLLNGNAQAPADPVVYTNGEPGVKDPHVKLSLFGMNTGQSGELSFHLHACVIIVCFSVCRYL